MTEERIALVARIIDPLERHLLDQTVSPEQRGKTWYEIKCGKCSRTFRMDAPSLDAIIKRFGYTYCADAFCGARLYYLPHEAVGDLEARRAQ